MAVIDVDTHFEPGRGWLADLPELAARLPEYSVAEATMRAQVGELLAGVPEDQRPPRAQLLPQVMLVSRCNAEALKYDRNAMMFHPSGTGPYRYSNMVAHERLELLANKDYWDKDRIPKHDKLVLIPMPEASTRAAALLSGQVNFIEAPDPDTIPRLKAAGMNVVTNTYPHNWGYQLNFENGPMRTR